ncbi:streptophobe family protein [Streptomyces sp. VNUA116]|uniref:streptophobe family protein n=1 Tax=Streptomyces sp. VNUA116 TaxID=3062449 RepID=UPI00267680D5|nr:streptophobe family protein [Streptomyces sp. VNUA116]WKU44236.1 streptophobe family protein [Streptomyces sp. VNUA116]
MTMDGGGRGVRPAELLLTSIAAVSWSFLAMAGIAALGLHLLGADAAGALGPMTAAAVVLAVGGSLMPSGDIEAFGLKGAGAHTAIDIAPLGVSLAGALLLGMIFARSLRRAGATIGAGELAARAASVVILFLFLLAGLAWAGEDSVTFDGSGLGLGGGGGGGGPKLEIPGIGDVGDIAGGLPDRLTGLVNAKAAVGFSIRTGPSLLGGTVWVLGVLLIAVLGARRAPLPRGWQVLHRGVRPAVAALCAVLVLAVGAGLAAAAYAATGDDAPKRVLGAALLGAPNGVFLAVPLGLFVSWHGTASGALTKVLPSPLDELLSARADEPVTLGRLAELDALVWLLAVACALMMLCVGVLTAVRTPRDGLGVTAFAARCAVALGVATAVALPLLVLATRVKVDASLSVLGFDVFGAGLELSGNVPMALALGAAWGAAAGAVGGVLACATGTAGRRAVVYGPQAADAAGPAAGAAGPAGAAHPGLAGPPGPYRPSPGRPARDDTNPYKRPLLPDERSTAPTQTGRPLPPPRRPRGSGYRYGAPPPEEPPPPPPGPPPRRR